jgi:hypothetical protein
MGAPKAAPLTNIILDWKSLHGANTLAYFACSSVTKEICFIRLTTGVNVIKLFYSSMTLQTIKLENTLQCKHSKLFC